ncbi:MAG: trypsin-like peptidase domain-containing protein [Clostridia bacterium]|nr:trypsin-like peptidase domain-containing protein [Clostridia bacterium]
MDELNRNTENDESQHTTPFQTPVRGADEQPGSGYTNTGRTYGQTQSSGTYSNTYSSDAQDSSSYRTQSNSSGSYGGGGSTPPPNGNNGSSYQQWSGGGKKPGKPKKNSNFPWKPIIAIVVVAAIAFGGGLLAGGNVKLPTMGTSTSSSSSTDTGSGVSSDSTKVNISSTAQDLGSYSEVYEKVSPSVVAIVVDEIQAGSESSGSGVIMSEDGYIITNNHVVSGGDIFTVVLDDATTYQATLVGTDEQTDLAVLKIDATGLTAAEFGDSDDVKVGDRAFAIGSPGGIEYQNSFTGGFISAINRNVTINDRVMSLIQTDTAINPGNSGGALINSAGQVIGITSSKLSASSMDSASIEGMGFAIPMSTTKEIVDELIANGHVTGRPAIGISGYDLDESRASYFNLPQGVYVSSVDTASDAYTKGIQAGDIITGVNGEEITGMSDINDVKSDLSAGDTITLTVYRNGATQDITITLIDEADLSGETADSSSDSSSNNSNSYTNPYSGYGYSYTIP